MSGQRNTDQRHQRSFLLTSVVFCSRSLSPLVCTNQPGIITQLTLAAEERPWLWVVYILTVGLPIGLVVLFCWPKVLQANFRCSPPLTRVAAISPAFCRPQKSQDDYVYKKANLPQADVEEEDEEEEEEAAGDKEEEVADEAKGAAAAGESCEHAVSSFLLTRIRNLKCVRTLADDAFNSGHHQGTLMGRKRKHSMQEVMQ